MYIIALPNNGIVLAKTTSTSITEQGLVRDDDAKLTYGFEVDVIEVADDEVPEVVNGYQYTYNTEEGFVEDPNYTPVGQEVTLEMKLEAALQKIADLEEAICELSIEVEEVAE